MAETTRIETLKKLLVDELASTQEELCNALEKKGFQVTQSTISRDLRRLGAIKTTDGDGRTIYRFPLQPSAPLARTSLENLILTITQNESMIVIRTTSGSASLVAAQIDQLRPAGILGTIAGDDTIFIAPASRSVISKIISTIRNALLYE